MHTEIWSGNLNRKDHLTDLGAKGRILQRVLTNKMLNAYRNLVRKPEQKRPLDTPRRKRQNITTCLN